MRQKIFYFSFEIRKASYSGRGIPLFVSVGKEAEKYAMALYFKEKSDSLLSVDLDAKQASQILTLQRKYEKESFF